MEYVFRFKILDIQNNLMKMLNHSVQQMKKPRLRGDASPSDFSGLGREPASDF